jgi:Bacterial Ig-like domain (group 2)
VAASGAARGEFEVTITAPTPGNAVVATVAVTLPSLRLVVGDTARAQASALDADGNLISGRAVVWSMVGSPSVATVSSTGLVTAVGMGSARITATIDGIAGSASITIADSSSGGGGSLPIVAPALPETLSFTYPKVTGRQWVVKAGGNLQTALNSAKRGDEIVLDAGARFVGNFTLPVKTGTPADGWVIIRSDKLTQLPAQGTRVTPTHAPLMAVIETPNSNPAIATAAGTSGWWIAGVEIVATETSATNYGIVTFGQGSGQNTLSQVPSDLVLDRTYVHGLTNTKVQRCIALNSARTAVQDSYVFDCHLKGFDSQAILGWNGPGPFRIVNNTLAGAGENIMFGGADPAIRDLTPGDIEIRRNYIYTPVSWKGTWTKKNLLELKNAQRVLIEGNVLEGSWKDGQTGDAFVLKVTNQGGKCTWCATRDVIIRSNVIRNVGSVFSVQGLEGGRPYPVGERLNRVLLEHNIAENVNVGAYTGGGAMLQLIQNAQNVVILNNTLTTTGPLGHFMNVGSEPAATNVQFERNIVTHGNYGLFSTKYGVGEKTLAAFRGSVIFRDVVIIGNTRTGYPNARFVATLQAALGGNMGADTRRVQNWTSDIVIP